MGGLRAIFYSEFDNITGPKIFYQTPKDYFAAEKFDGISDFVITGKQLCGKLITVHAFGHKVVGYPMCIENEIYNRNALLFNVGFIFDEDASDEPYHPIIRKLATVLCALEQESQFLFNPREKERLAFILPRVLHDLNTTGECSFVLNDANMLNLKLFRMPDNAVQVHDHQVPVLLLEKRKLEGWDFSLALAQVIPHIDGIKYAKLISISAGVDIDIVKRCLRALFYYNCVALCDIFQYSNIYATTSRCAELARRFDLQEDLQQFVVNRRRSSGSSGVKNTSNNNINNNNINNNDDEEEADRYHDHRQDRQYHHQSHRDHHHLARGGSDGQPSPKPPPPHHALVHLLCACQPGITAGELLVKSHPRTIDADSFDHRKLFTSAVLHGYIRRVHRYPICLKSSGNFTTSSSTSSLSWLASGSSSGHGGGGGGSGSGGQHQKPRRHHHHHHHHHHASTTSSSAASAGGGSSGSGSNNSGNGSGGHGSTSTTMHAVQSMMNGRMSTDEICVHFMLPLAKIESIARGDGSQIVYVNR